MSASQQWQRLGPALEVPEPTPTEPVLSQRKPPPAEKEPQSADAPPSNDEVSADDEDQLGRVVLQEFAQLVHAAMQADGFGPEPLFETRARFQRLHDAVVTGVG